MPKKICISKTKRDSDMVTILNADVPGLAKVGFRFQKPRNLEKCKM